MVGTNRSNCMKGAAKDLIALMTVAAVAKIIITKSSLRKSGNRFGNSRPSAIIIMVKEFAIAPPVSLQSS